MRPDASPLFSGYRPERFFENPLITPAMLGNADENINGPSLIRNPARSGNGLGAYLLYFAHHEGRNIRLAHADDLRGPWRIHEPGVLPCAELPWRPDHVASPDMHVDGRNKRILMYFHSPVEPMIPSSDPDYLEKAARIPQKSFVAVSEDGLRFTVRERVLGDSYFRAWQWKNHWYALPRLAKPLLRASDPFGPFEEFSSPFSGRKFGEIRHTAVMAEGDELTLFFTRIGDAPEHILFTRVRMRDDPTLWTAAPPVSLLLPETGYEGRGVPVRPSRFGAILGMECALRDPCVFRENGRIYLLYCVMAERGIAACELVPV